MIILSGTGTLSAAPINPNDQPDIWEWWEVSRETGLNNGDEITQLTGQKNARHFTNATVGQRPIYDTVNAINGHAVANCNANPRQLFGPDMSALTAVHFFLVLNKLDQNNGGTIGKFSTQADSSHYAFTDGKIYENAFRSDDRLDLGAPVLSLEDPRVWEVSSITNEWKAFLDGLQQGTTQLTNTVGAPSNPRLGHSGVNPFTGGLFAGGYLFSAKISGAARAGHIAYMNDRFATTAI